MPASVLHAARTLLLLACGAVVLLATGWALTRRGLPGRSHPR
jgi:nitrogen fixation protein